LTVIEEIPSEDVNNKDATAESPFAADTFLKEDTPNVDTLSEGNELTSAALTEQTSEDATEDADTTVTTNLNLLIIEDTTLLVRENTLSQDGTDDIYPEHDVVTLDEITSPVRNSSDGSEDLEAQGADETQEEPPSETHEDKTEQEAETMVTPTKALEATLDFDSSEKKKQKKRKQKETKQRQKDIALQEVGVQTPIKDSEENLEVEIANISHPLAKSSKKNMADHFKKVESPSQRAAKTRLQASSRLPQKNSK
jgi:hypothetical protein